MTDRRERPAAAGIVQPVVAGVIGTVTGFFGSVAVLLAGLAAAGATPRQAASGVIALCLLQAVLSITLSTWRRIPFCFAWSTPGAALLVVSHGATGSFDAAVGAFLLAGLLVLLTGSIGPLARLVDRIPAAISGALLAGILLPFCLAPLQHAATAPWLVLPLIAGWLVLTRFLPRFAGPAVIVAALVITVATGTAGQALPPGLVWTTPAITPIAVVGLGIPLYLVTMAGQNLPGLAVLRANDYRPPTRLALLAGGVGTALAAPFGGVAVNLAAITGAIMVGPEAGEDRSRRWLAGVGSGVTYLLLALIAGPIAGLVGTTPPSAVSAAVGLALLGAFVGGVVAAVQQPETRIPAALTFVTVASGVTIAGVGSPFWGVVVGGIALLILRPRRELRRRRP